MAKKIPQPHGGAISSFPKGKSGNPNGRPKGARNRSTIAREILEMTGILPDNIFSKLKEVYPSIQKNMSVEHIMTIVIANKAISKGDAVAYEKIMDSAHGKAMQAHELTGLNGGPIETKKVLSKEEIQLELKKRGLPTQIFS